MEKQDVKIKIGLAELNAPKNYRKTTYHIDNHLIVTAGINNCNQAFSAAEKDSERRRAHQERTQRDGSESHASLLLRPEQQGDSWHPRA